MHKGTRGRPDALPLSSCSLSLLCRPSCRCLSGEACPVGQSTIRMSDFLKIMFVKLRLNIRHITTERDMRERQKYTFMNEAQTQETGCDVEERSLCGAYGAALPEGSIILGGRYRLVRLLHCRPRVHLYLARRLVGRRERIQYSEEPEPLVAVRELLLTGLSAGERMQIERAAYEEYASLTLLASPRLPEAADSLRVEGDRHYLVQQLVGLRQLREIEVMTLADLLLSDPRWPRWLTLEVAISWSIQLARLVARLHRLGCLLGDLDPATVLIDAEGRAPWAPTLLVSWPPPPVFWQATVGSIQLAGERYRQLFPPPAPAATNPFAAPEVFAGSYSERSDVYSLGALLYLLVTHFAPVTATHRQLAQMLETGAMEVDLPDLLEPLPVPEGLALVPPHLLNSRLPPMIEVLLLRALALDPELRYPSAFALVEELEALDLRQLRALRYRRTWPAFLLARLKRLFGGR
jgi:serine/threonine protein kinase